MRRSVPPSRVSGRPVAPFGNQIAEIGTIADKSFGGNESIAAKVKSIATAFNQPLDKTAEAYYQALSNGFSESAQAETLMTDASKFAKAAVTSLDNSVNLLTATLNAYGMEASKTGDVSGKFFETIRLGRLRADDIANSFGRVSVISKEAGVSLDETLGALATLTIQGQKPAEAMTALRSAINSFLKPSDAMKDKLQELGFSSGPAALQTLGLAGALKQLAGTVNGSADGMAKLFPNVRALNGALVLGVSSADKFASFTTTIKNAGSALNDQKFGEVMASDSQKLTTELNRLKIALTTDLGTALVDDANKMLGLVGGAQTLIDAGKTLGPVIETVAFSLGAYGAAAAVAAAKNKLLETTMGRLGLVAGTVGLAMGAGNLLGDKLSAYSDSSIRKLEAANALELQQAKNTAAAKLKIAQDAEDARVSAILSASQKAAQAYQGELDKAREADAAVVASAKNAGERIISAREKIVEALGHAIDRSKTIQSESAGRVTGLQEKSSDRKFQFDTRHLSDARKYQEYISHSLELAKQASRQLQAASSTGNEKGIQAALRTFGQAQHYGEQADQISQRLGNRRKESDAMSNLNSLTKQQIRAEQQLSAVQEKRQTDLDAERESQRGILDTVKKNLAVVAETSASIDKQGNPLSAGELAANTAKRQAALVNIIKAGSKNKDLSLADSLGLARLGTDLSKTPITLAMNVENGAAGVQRQLDAAFRNYKLRINIDVEALQTALGKAFRNPAEVTGGIKQAQGEAAKLREQSVYSPQTTQQMRQVLMELQAIENTSNSAGRNIGRFWTTIINPSAGGQAQKALTTFREDLANVASSANIGDQDIARLVKELGQLKTAASAEKNGGPFGLVFFQKDIQQYAEAISKVKTLQGLQGQRAASPANQSRLNVLDQALGATAERFTPLQSAIGTASGGIGQLGGAAQQAAGALSRLNAPTPAPVPEIPIGGLPHLAVGGRPRGVDRIPAMLAPGEFVVNARSSNRFAAQLTAMNAGIHPNYRAAGGAVTNVGDITVNVASGQTPAHSGRVIAQSIRRELRRNTTVL